MSTTKRKAIALIRVSTDQQETRRQRTDVARVAQAHNLSIERTVELEDVSGRSVLQNHEVQRLLADLKRADISGVVISALDRLFRPERYADFGILDSFRETGKLIFSAKEGSLDPASDAGFMMSLMSGAQAGMEWRELRRRSMQGKEEARKLGRHVCGTASLPRGVAFESGVWQYIEPDASRVKRAFALLLAGDSYRTIAAKIGGGWTGEGISRSMRSRTWLGYRVYKADKNRPEALQVKVLPPLVARAVWDQAQQILLTRKTDWHKTKGEPKALAVGLLRCSCGKRCFTRVASAHDHPSKKDYYYCASLMKKHGPPCGARYARRESVDGAVERIVTGYLTPARLLKILAQRRPSERPAQAKRIAQALEKLDGRRARLTDLAIDGHIDKTQFVTRLRALDEEIEATRGAMPRESASVEKPAEVAEEIARLFATFPKLPFLDRREIVRQVFKTFTLATDQITAATLNGGFLAQFVSPNLSAQSRS